MTFFLREIVHDVHVTGSHRSLKNYSNLQEQLRHLVAQLIFLFLHWSICNWWTCISVWFLVMLRLPPVTEELVSESVRLLSIPLSYQVCKKYNRLIYHCILIFNSFMQSCIKYAILNIQMYSRWFQQFEKSKNHLRLNEVIFYVFNQRVLQVYKNLIFFLHHLSLQSIIHLKAK